jgi:hypothetical protein
MSDFDLNDVIARLTAKIAADLKKIVEGETVANVTMNNAPATCTEVHFEPVNALEQTSLKALICWVAANCNVAEAQVVARLADTFHADDVAHIDREDFDEAVAWLVDFKPALN